MATQALALPLPATVRALKDVPALRQLLMLLGVALAVAAGIFVYRWSQQPGHVPVYANLPERDVAELADALRAANIPFRVDPASGAVTVAESQVHEARLKLAAQGLPRGSGAGFESIREEQGFGTSQFIESARYQHALETELARSVGTLQPVRGARVHLALPKPSAFTRDRGSASASVLVELHPGRQLEQVQVASIVHMVASSVPGLLPAAVTVIDQYGHLLSGNDADSAMAQSAEQFDQARRIEADFVRRIEQLLTPMLGPGRVSAQVTADMDFSVTEEARESYSPERTVLRSEQTSEDTTRGSAQPQGIPGATSNQPPGQTANPPLNTLGGTATAVDATTQSRQATRNFEVDKTVSHTRQGVGRIRRLSVAVLVDYVPQANAEGVVAPAPLAPEQLAKVDALVREAVGFTRERGDSVVVQNAAFVQPDAQAPEDLPLWKQPAIRDLVRQGGGALLLLILILTVVRPTLRKLMDAPLAPPKPAGAALEGVVEPAEGQLAEDRVSLAGEGGADPSRQLGYEHKLQLARTAVAQDPKRVAQVVKTWVSDGG